MSESFTQREIQLLEMAAAGLRHGDIAEAMHLHPGTIKRYLSELYQKLGADNQPHAVALAFRRGLLK